MEVRAVGPLDRPLLVHRLVVVEERRGGESDNIHMETTKDELFRW
jgi:hypothetical protein